MAKPYNDQKPSRLHHQNRQNLLKSIGGGKVPPQSVELEKAVLGAIIVEQGGIDEVVDILMPESFYLEKHLMIFSAILEIFRKVPAEPIDYFTVKEELKKRGELDLIGGASYLVDLDRHIKTGANLEVYARKLQEYALKRQLIEVSYEIQREGYEDSQDAFELLDSIQQDLLELSEQTVRKSYASVKDILSNTIAELEGKRESGDGLTGIPSGYESLDRYTSGWQKGDLVILAARPGVGKTAFVINALRNAAVNFNKPVALFSMEMPSTQIMTRLLSLECELNSEAVRNGKLSEEDWQRVYNKAKVLEKAPIFIDDSAGISITELRAKCRRLQNQYGISMIAIDYLQLMSANMGSRQSFNREQEISTISRNLKELAKELSIPVIVLSQLNRAVESRHEKRPQLSDLRESGAIEQDADIVMFLYRPEYHNINENEAGENIEGLTELIIGKHRSGSQGTVNLRFVKEYTRFTDWDDDGFAGLTPMSDLGGGGPDGFESDSGSITISSSINNMDDDHDQGNADQQEGEDEEDMPF